MGSKGTVAEGILLKMILQNGIEAEHGSPSRPGDIIVMPNVIIEIKDPKERSFSFRDHGAKGEAQWNALKAKNEMFPWIEIFYVIRFARKEWRFFSMPEEPRPLHLADGKAIENLFPYLKRKQEDFQKTIVKRRVPVLAAAGQGRA